MESDENGAYVEELSRYFSSLSCCFFNIDISTLIQFLAVAKNRLQSPLTVSRSFSVETSEWYSWPRQREGNIYSVNWSLVEDGVVPVGDAFHNARINLLTNRLGVKANVQSIDKSKPLYFGKYSVLEAGDSISHEDFQAMFTAQCHYLSSGIDLFVEDGALGSFYNTRLGVRIVSDDPSVALIGRSLLVRLY